MCHTLLYQLYQLARRDEEDVQLLQDCNQVFLNRKELSKKGVSSKSTTKKDDNLPDFSDAIKSIAERLKVSVVVVIDETDSLSLKDQQKLANRLQDLIKPCEPAAEVKVDIKALVGCRLGTEFYNHIISTGERGAELEPRLHQRRRLQQRRH